MIYHFPIVTHGKCISFGIYETLKDEVFCFAEGETVHDDDYSLNRVSYFLKILSKIEQVDDLFIRDYLNVFLLHNCPVTFLKAYPNESMTPWIKTTLMKYIDLHGSANDNVKKLVHHGLSEFVKSFKTWNVLSQKEVLQLQRILPFYGPPKEASQLRHAGFFKVLTVAGAMGGLYFTGGLGGFIGGALTGHIGSKLLTSCRRSQP